MDRRNADLCRSRNRTKPVRELLQNVREIDFSMFRRRIQAPRASGDGPGASVQRRSGVLLPDPSPRAGGLIRSGSADCRRGGSTRQACLPIARNFADYAPHPADDYLCRVVCVRAIQNSPDWPADHRLDTKRIGFERNCPPFRRRCQTTYRWPGPPADRAHTARSPPFSKRSPPSQSSIRSTQQLRPFRQRTRPQLSFSATLDF